MSSPCALIAHLSLAEAERVLARRSLRETAGAAIPMVTLAIAVYALYGAVTGVIRYQRAMEKQRSVELQRGAGVQVPRAE